MILKNPLATCYCLKGKNVATKTNAASKQLDKVTSITNVTNIPGAQERKELVGALELCRISEAAAPT